MSETTHICSLQVLPVKYGHHVKGWLAFMHANRLGTPRRTWHSPGFTPHSLTGEAVFRKRRGATSPGVVTRTSPKKIPP